MADLFEGEGVVSQVYEKTRGFKFENDEENGNPWYNLSKLGDAAKLPMPAKGQRIKIGYVLVNGKPFVEQWSPVDLNQYSPPFPSSPAELARLNARPRDDKPVVTRLACLNAAVATAGHFSEFFGQEAARAEGMPEDLEGLILGLAERYVAWATYGGNGGQSVPVAGNPLGAQSLSNEPEKEPGGVSAGLPRSG